MSNPNDRLRGARERTRSPRLPGAPMSRQEVADAANAWLAEHTDREGGMDARYIGRLERGAVRWPNADYRAALRATLTAATDLELGFVYHRTGDNDGVDRKTFLKTALGVGAGAVVAPQLSGHDASDLAAAIAGPTANYRRMENAVSTTELTPAVAAHLRLASGIVADTLPTADGYGVLAETTGLAAWLAADRGDTGTARRHYADAVAHAERAHHPLLTEYMRASLGQFAVESGDPRQGLALLRRARAGLDGSAPDAACAWLASLHATAHAALGDRHTAHHELRDAERLTERHRGEPRWPFVFAFDTAKCARYQSATLASLGDTDAARVAYAAATPALTAPKPRALAQIDHARALGAAGHVAEACTLATDALTIGRRYRSERITQKVRNFRATLPAVTTDATTLDDALTALYAEGTR